MSSVLVRGLRFKTRRRIQHFAEKQNLSANQVLLKVIDEGLNQVEKKLEKEAHEKSIYQQILELREEIYRKHGAPKTDSTQLIREDRDHGHWPDKLHS